MHWKKIAARVARSVAEPDHAIVIELASAALFLAWMAHWAVE
jgi:hypothetical protein